MRVLVTNDDGIAAPGLHALAGAATTHLPAEVMVVAPSDDQSGSGAAVGPLHLPGRVVFDPVVLPGLDLVPAYRVACPPALGVLTACLGGYGVRPDLVLSGINPGANLGVAVLHSGTVGAALTAANVGLPALAVSLDAGDPPRWDTAAAVAGAAARWLAGVDQAMVLNVNIPNLALDELAGVRPASLSRFGAVRAAFTLAGEAAGEERELELRQPAAGLDPGTDAALLRAGYVTVTALHGLQAAASLPAEAAAAVEAMVPARPPAAVHGV